MGWIRFALIFVLNDLNNTIENFHPQILSQYTLFSFLLFPLYFKDKFDPYGPRVAMLVLDMLVNVFFFY